MKLRKLTGGTRVRVMTAPGVWDLGIVLAQVGNVVEVAFPLAQGRRQVCRFERELVEGTRGKGHR